MKPKVTKAAGMIAGCSATKCISIALLGGLTDVRRQLSDEPLATVIGLGANRVENTGGSVEIVRSASDQIVVDEVAKALRASVAAILQAGMNLASNVNGDIVADVLNRIAFDDQDRTLDLAGCDVDDDLPQRIASDIRLDEGVTGIAAEVSHDEIKHTISDAAHIRFPHPLDGRIESTAFNREQAKRKPRFQFFRKRICFIGLHLTQVIGIVNRNELTAKRLGAAAHDNTMDVDNLLPRKR